MRNPLWPTVFVPACVAAITITITALGALVAPQPALATGNTWCNAKEGDASISLLTGRLPILHVLDADITWAGETWSTQKREGARPMLFGQGMMEDRRLAADFVDPNVERILFSLRVDFSGYEGEEPVAGKLTGHDGKTIDVLCQGDG